MTARPPRFSALTLRPVEGLALAGGTTRWARTVGEAELLLRRTARALPPGAEPRRFEVAVLFAGGARQHAEITLCREDAHREASPWEGVLAGWATDAIQDGDRARTRLLTRMDELVRHVAHHRTVGEFVDVYEHLDDDLDTEGVARRDRVVASPRPAPLTGSRYSDDRSLDLLARDVRKDIEAAVVSGLLPEGLRCEVRIEQYETGPGLEIEVQRAPGLWIPDLCEMCVPVAYGIQAPPEGGLTCGHTPTRAGHSRAAEGVLLTLLAIGDVYDRDASRLDGRAYVVQSAFDLATCFDGALGRSQRETLRSSEQAMRELARRRAAAA